MKNRKKLERCQFTPCLMTQDVIERVLQNLQKKTRDFGFEKTNKDTLLKNSRWLNNYSRCACWYHNSELTAIPKRPKQQWYKFRRSTWRNKINSYDLYSYEDYRHVPTQDFTFFYTGSHLIELQSCTLIFSTNFNFLKY